MVRDRACPAWVTAVCGRTSPRLPAAAQRVRAGRGVLAPQLADGRPPCADGWLRGSGRSVDTANTHAFEGHLLAAPWSLPFPMGLCGTDQDGPSRQGGPQAHGSRAEACPGSKRPSLGRLCGPGWAVGTAGSGSSLDPSRALSRRVTRARRLGQAGSGVVGRVSGMSWRWFYGERLYAAGNCILCRLLLL